MTVTPCSVADAILKQLHYFGVDYIFGVSGDAILGLLDAFSRQTQIQFIGVRHESAAGFMASAYAKLTGKVGVCVATSGPGMANLLNGLGDAYGDHTPVLAITGQVPTHKIGTQSKQYIDQQRLAEPLAAYSALVASPKSIIPLLHHAFQTAIANQSVTHLSIPKDIFLQPQYAEIGTSFPTLYHKYPSDSSQLEKAIQFLRKCKRPLILAGKGAQSCGHEISRLAEILGAGIICSLGAKGVIGEQNEFLLGGIGEGGSEEAEPLIKDCDGLIIIGAMWYPKEFLSPSIPFIQIEQYSDHIQQDKNLHTALIGDSSTILNSLIERLSSDSFPDSKWIEKIKVARKFRLNRMEMEGSDNSVPIAPSRVMKELAGIIDSRAIISLDTGDHTVWFNRSFPSAEQQLVFSGTWRTLGYALPAANAAQLLYPNRQVIAISGDGGFTMSLAELSTSVQYELPIKMIIFNNHSFAMEKNKMEYMGLQPFATDLTNPDFSRLANAFGIASWRITDPNDLKPALMTWIQTKGPALLEVISSTLATPLSKAKAASSSP